jgi:membrane protein implicated in regulation of membrane protease activity
VSNGEWLSLVVACGVAIVGLLVAAANRLGTGYWLGLAIFVAAVIYSALAIKRYFDRIERQRH